MTPELFILLIIGTLGGGGAGVMVWVRRAQRQYVNRMQSEWVRAGQIVHFGPIGVTCYGHRPERVYGSGVFGALGLTGDHLVFSGMSNNKFDLRVPLDHIRLIGVGRITLWAGKTTAQVRAVSVHFESSEGWQVASFAIREPVEFGQALGVLCGLVVYDTGKKSHDFGPARATQLSQDIYGEWTADRQGRLYLIPDRLIFDWGSAILLAQVRRLDVIERGGLNPFAGDLLRIEHETIDGEIAVTGYEVRHAQQWADKIARYTGVPLAVQSGRKKK